MAYRPSNRIYWHGWNEVAGLLALIGFVSALLTWFIASSAIGETDLAKAITFGVAGFAVICGDLIYRGRNLEFSPLWRFVSPYAGGWVVIMPAWIVGAWMVGTAFYFRLKAVW